MRFRSFLFQRGLSRPDRPAPLQRGEPVRVVNASPEGELKFKLPARRFDISLWIKGKESAVIPVLDTVVIEPDEKRLLLTWRATAPCFKQFLYIDRVRVKEKAG
ncbi:MAG: DUF2169 domain-containing protein [Candidatus Manganitrophus sp.]|nr:DUF2169 domain-containing protein [Candidatus Manganitrophus sp.]